MIKIAVVCKSGGNMQSYSNLGGDSGVAAYETGADFIRVQFNTGAVYRYTHASCGSGPCETMKTLAAGGEGLNAYINTHVRKGYEAREL
jgi:hypothetical protein